jgi:hypothetical protein
MISKIPKEKTEFIKDLEWNFKDSSYKHPNETLQWERTSMTLQKLYSWGIFRASGNK